MNLHPNQTCSSTMTNPFEQLFKEMCELKQLVYTLVSQIDKNQDDLIDINEASLLVKLKKDTIYNLSSKGDIPVVKRPGSSKILFSRKDLENWVSGDRQKKNIHIEDQLLKFRREW